MEGGEGQREGRQVPVAVLALFVGLHIINHVDRHLIASFAPQIMADLTLSRAEFALIAGLAFSLVYAATALGAGLLADRIGRVRVLASGAGVWSLFTALGGLASGFWSLLLLRPFVAMGEATLVPTATNILLARTRDTARATVTGIFFMGIPLGVGTSYFIAAELGSVIGWRSCFFLMGAIGLIAAIAATRVRDVGDVVHAHFPSKGHAIRETLDHLWVALRRNRRVQGAVAAITLFHAHMATAPFTQLWLTSDKGLPSENAATIYGAMFILLGAAGSVGSGILVDHLHARYCVDRARSLAIVMAILAPLLIAYRLAPGGSGLMFVGMAASILWFGAAYGPCFAIIERELPPNVKATVTGATMLLINVLMIGLLGLMIGVASSWMAAAGFSDSWTWPLLGADILAMLGIAALWKSAKISPRAG